MATSLEQPKDTVYHVTPLVNLESISEHGLLSDPGRDGLELRMLADEAADLARAPELITAGISRRNAVYAHLSLEKIRRYSDGVAGATSRGEHSVILGISIDPHRVLVADAKMIDEVGHAIQAQQREGKSEASQEAIRHAAEKYWDTAIPLSEYRELYNQDTRRLNNPFTERSLLSYYARPEVLIPDEVAPYDIEWAASILLRQEIKAG